MKTICLKIKKGKLLRTGENEIKWMASTIKINETGRGWVLGA